MLSVIEDASVSECSNKALVLRPLLWVFFAHSAHTVQLAVALLPFIFDVSLSPGLRWTEPDDRPDTKANPTRDSKSLKARRLLYQDSETVLCTLTMQVLCTTT